MQEDLQYGILMAEIIAPDYTPPDSLPQESAACNLHHNQNKN